MTVPMASLPHEACYGRALRVKLLNLPMTDPLRNQRATVKAYGKHDRYDQMGKYEVS